MRSVLLDTSFLISLSTDARAEHQTAKAYFRRFIEQGVVMLLSTIVVSEYEIRQRVSDLGLHHFLTLPYNYDDAIATAAVFSAMYRNREVGDDRVAVKDDAKLVGQCLVAGASHFATADEQCAARLERLRASSALPGLPFAINIREPFGTHWFNEGHQTDLDWSDDAGLG